MWGILPFLNWSVEEQTHLSAGEKSPAGYNSVIPDAFHVIIVLLPTRFVNTKFGNVSVKFFEKTGRSTGVLPDRPVRGVRERS
jgi:hypothetical protein